MKLGFLYAGQGSQHPGMGADLYEAYPAFRAVFDSAPVEFDLKQVCFQDPDGVLNQTQYTQPCMVAFAAGLTAVLRERGIPVSYTHLDVYKRQALEGFATNAELSYQILYHPAFVRGSCTTAFLDENLAELLDFSRRLEESEGAQ